MEITKDNTLSIKGFAISAMLWHHLFWCNDAYAGWAQVLGIFGKVCVALFLFVSGYGLAKQFGNTRVFSKETVRFLLKRFAKFYLSVWPWIFFAIFVGVVGFGRGFSEAYPGLNPIKSMAKDFLGISGYFSYIKTWWFNRLILQLYLLFPFLVLLLRNRYVKWVGFMVIVALEQFDLLPFFCIQQGGLTTFYLGMLMANAEISWPQKMNKFGRMAVYAALLAVCVFLRYPSPLVKYTLIDGCMALAISGILVELMQWLRLPVLKAIGQRSTPLYLTHSMWIGLTPAIVYWPRFAPLVFLLLFAISYAVVFAGDAFLKLIRYNKLTGFVVGKIEKL
ncbi:MAG: acyltransferase family protein [Bacteroidales bacterium]|nr:acyltransferase family protein [Bacteroidales bacterium]